MTVADIEKAIVGFRMFKDGLLRSADDAHYMEEEALFERYQSTRLYRDFCDWAQKTKRGLSPLLARFLILPGLLWGSSGAFRASSGPLPALLRALMFFL